MSSQCQSKTPQPTPGHIHDYSQVMDEELVILTNDSTNTEQEKTWREREHKVEHKAKHEEAKRQKAEEERLEAEQRKRAEEEEVAQRKKGAEEEAERQRQRAQARWDKATQSVQSGHCNQQTAMHLLYKWEWERQLQPVEMHAEAHEKAATAFERMARAAEQMAEATEWTANKWELYCEWVEQVEMRRREDMHEAKMAKFEHTGGGWKRPQSEVAEDRNEEVDEGAEGDNKEEEEVGGEQEGREEQEGGRKQVMEE
ncbi:hypothetical protein BKA82DRAFT_33363 [Pisolithus tinctorius]|uniref:Uncharacterized protein n=1 Tax=Pisolithus tinctorius Marx 270 TaxID=870435 RepID=A0A0C3JFK3_PISTI|nr:hypothetical protein BKA82DRAFT_33363 [Pisolithus tinctorius]KIN96381.1 hypothetical protein M404DRAFT_33363 [Pisolithus tinctorius Marx 270]